MSQPAWPEPSSCTPLGAPSQVKDAQVRRYAAYGLLALGVLAFRSVTANHLWKTGMRTHWYWP